jgi:hypothetical protein
VINSLSTCRTFLIIFIAGLFILAARGVHDPDLWWHLRSGQQIVQTHAIPRYDLFSYTKSGERWIAHEWLSEVIFYLIYRMVGWAGLITLFSGVIGGAFLITYFRCRGRPYVAGLVVLLWALASAPTWGVRPQMFSVLLAAIFLALLEGATRDGNTSRLWWLVPLTILWVNLHGGYAIGLAFIVLTMLGWYLELGRNPLALSEERNRLRSTALVLLACVAVIPLNPNGIKLYSYPFETLQSPAMQRYISEWASPNFHEGDFKPLLVLLLLTFVAAAISRIHLSAPQFFLLLATTYAALVSARHIPLLALVASPIIAERVYGLGPAFGSSGRESSPSRIKFLLNATLVLGIVVFAAVRLTQVVRQQPGQETKYFPTAAVNFIVRHHPVAPVFNYYDWGGYIIWRLYPEYRVFVDGRADLYGDKYMEEMADALHAEKNWQEPIRRFGVGTVLVPPNIQLAAVLGRDPRWAKVFEDGQAVIFTRKRLR